MTPPPAGEDIEGVRWDSYNNTSFIDAFVHTGTHVDTAFHVSKNGPKLGSFKIEDFVFEKPLVLSIPKDNFEHIEVADLEPYTDQLMRSDLLLVYTGFSQYRNTDPERYMTKQPGFHPKPQSIS